MIKVGDVIIIATVCKHTVEAIKELDIVEVQLDDEISASEKIKFDVS